MHRNTVVLLVLLALGIGVSVIVAAPGGPIGGFAIDWWTVDGGGDRSEGGVYAVSGTIGQADAGTVTGGEYVVEGGFWGLREAAGPIPTVTPMPTPEPGYGLYLPTIVK